MPYIRFDKLPGGAPFRLMNGELWEKLPRAIPMPGDAQHPQKHIVNAKTVRDGVIELRNIAECALVQTEIPAVTESRVVPFKRRRDG